MKTLLEYMTFVKGVEYLIVIAFCFAFIALWILVHSKERAAISRVVSIVLPLSLVFGGGAIVLSASDTPDNASVINISDAIVPVQTGGAEPVIAASGWMKVNESEYLFIKYGQATEFHSIMSEKVSCTTCHHNSGDEIHSCKECHGSPTNPHDSTKPGLKAAYHQRCVECHKAEFSGPDSCLNCHKGDVKENAVVPAIVAAPNRPHQLTWDTCPKCHPKGIPNGGVESKIVYHDSCIKCHSTGVAGAALEPADHAGRAANTCQGCHKPAGV